MGNEWEMNGKKDEEKMREGKEKMSMEGVDGMREK